MAKLTDTHLVILSAAAQRDIAVLAEAAMIVGGSGEGELENGPETSR